MQFYPSHKLLLLVPSVIVFYCVYIFEQVIFKNAKPETPKQRQRREKLYSGIYQIIQMFSNPVTVHPQI